MGSLENFISIDGKKFMWNGEEYESESDAVEHVTTYRNDGFETKLIEEDGKYLVYTRRVAKDVVVEGAPV